MTAGMEDLDHIETGIKAGRFKRDKRGVVTGKDICGEPWPLPSKRKAKPKKV